MNFIGIDLGTSAVKLMLTDENGTAVKTVSETYPISYPHPNEDRGRFLVFDAGSMFFRSLICFVTF